MQTPLPPLGTLQGLFHYNPLTGSLTYLTDRGPRKAGEPAGKRVNGRWHVFVDGRYYPATEVAMALHRQRDHCPLWVHTINGDYNDIKIANLFLSENDPRPREGKVKAGPRNARRGSARNRDKHIKRCGNKWRAYFYKDKAMHYLGTFDSKAAAKLARDIATASDMTPARAKVYALEQVPQKAETKTRAATESDGYAYRPASGARVLLSDAIIKAKTSQLDLRRTRFRTIPEGQIFYYGTSWFVKRSRNSAARADTKRKHPPTHFSGMNTVRVLRDPLSPFL